MARKLITTKNRIESTVVIGLRIPLSLYRQVDYIYQHDLDMKSRNRIVMLALQNWLPGAVDDVKNGKKLDRL